MPYSFFVPPLNVKTTILSVIEDLSIGQVYCPIYYEYYEKDGVSHLMNSVSSSGGYDVGEPSLCGSSEADGGSYKITINNPKYLCIAEIDIGDQNYYPNLKDSSYEYTIDEDFARENIKVRYSHYEESGNYDSIAALTSIKGERTLEEEIILS